MFDSLKVEDLYFRECKSVIDSPLTRQRRKDIHE